jgi:hypothetical protein
MKSTDFLSSSTVSENVDPWSPEELARYWATVPKSPYRKYDMTQGERDQVAKTLRVLRKARRIEKETGQPVFEVEYRGEIHQFLKRIGQR